MEKESLTTCCYYTIECNFFYIGIIKVRNKKKTSVHLSECELFVFIIKENLMVSKRILKELKIIKDASDCYNASIVNDDIYHWQGSIIGPVDSPYEGGVFRLDIKIPPDFPLNPPQIRFKTKIYHPNIHLTGDICIDILKSQWNSTWSIEKLLLGIYSLLTDANPDDPYNARAALYYREDREKFNEIATWWTKKYAK